MSEWTDELKAEVIEKYLEQEPTEETSAQIVNDLAQEYDKAPNGVRMILIKGDVYVKKNPSSTSSTAKEGGSKRVSKADAQDALRSAISAKGLEPDNDIIDKLTGKAAIYFTEVLS